MRRAWPVQSIIKALGAGLLLAAAFAAVAVPSAQAAYDDAIAAFNGGRDRTAQYERGERLLRSCAWQEDDPVCQVALAELYHRGIYPNGRQAPHKIDLNEAYVWYFLAATNPTNSPHFAHASADLNALKSKAAIGCQAVGTAPEMNILTRQGNRYSFRSILDTAAEQCRAARKPKPAPPEPSDEAQAQDCDADVDGENCPAPEDAQDAEQETAEETEDTSTALTRACSIKDRLEYILFSRGAPGYVRLGELYWQEHKNSNRKSPIADATELVRALLDRVRDYRNFQFYRLTGASREIRRFVRRYNIRIDDSGYSAGKTEIDESDVVTLLDRRGPLGRALRATDLKKKEGNGGGIFGCRDCVFSNWSDEDKEAIQQALHYYYNLSLDLIRLGNTLHSELRTIRNELANLQTALRRISDQHNCPSVFPDNRERAFEYFSKARQSFYATTETAYDELSSELNKTALDVRLNDFAYLYPPEETDYLGSLSLSDHSIRLAENDIELSRIYLLYRRAVDPVIRKAINMVEIPLQGQLPPESFEQKVERFQKAIGVPATGRLVPWEIVHLIKLATRSDMTGDDDRREMLIELGKMYYNGYGVEQDREQAYEMFRRSATRVDEDGNETLNGDPVGACYMLALAWDGRDITFASPSDMRRLREALRNVNTSGAEFEPCREAL